jgi:hypothetical protein
MLLLASAYECVLVSQVTRPTGSLRNDMTRELLHRRYDHLRSRQNISDMEWSTILCGDIGGTNSRLRLFKVGADEHIDGANVPGELLFQKEYANETYARCAQLTLLPRHLSPSRGATNRPMRIRSWACGPSGLRPAGPRDGMHHPASYAYSGRGTIHHPRGLTACARLYSPAVVRCQRAAPVSARPRRAPALDLLPCQLHPRACAALSRPHDTHTAYTPGSLVQLHIDGLGASLGVAHLS